MKNKRVKQMMASLLFESKFDGRFHSVTGFDFPIMTCWNCELHIEQFSSAPSKLVSLTANQLKGIK